MPVERRRIHHQASHAVSNLTTFLGSFTAIAVAAVLVTIWAIGLLFVRGGPFNTHYAMVITSVTTMVTFVMVFIIQSTQNRESRAMQTKLDALLIAKHGLDEGELLGLEDKPDGAIRDVQTDVHDTERRADGTEQRLNPVVSVPQSDAVSPLSPTAAGSGTVWNARGGRVLNGAVVRCSGRRSTNVAANVP